MRTEAIFSSASDHWETPAETYAALNREFGFTFDPCPLNAERDGRKIPWSGRVFCNPPYSAIDAFLRRGLYHLAKEDCEILVYLLPARTDTRWFHAYCLHGEIRFLRGRLKFGKAKNSAPFPSMVAIFRDWKLPVLSLSDNH